MVRGFLVHEDPEAHPDEAQGADHDEGHLPAPGLRQQRNGQRGEQRADRSAGIEDRGGVGAVLLGEVLGGHLDGCREVARLAQGEDAARGDEEIHADHGDGRGQGRPGLDGAQRGGVGKPHPCLGGDAAEGVHAGSHRPDADGPQITFLGAHPVDETAREEHADGIDDREDRSDQPVVVLVPVEFGLDELVPRQREHLTVEVVNGRCEEEHRTDDPAILRHLPSESRFVVCHYGV